MVDHDDGKRYAVGDLTARRVGKDGNRPGLGGLLDKFGAVIMIVAALGVGIYVLFYFIGKRWASWEA